MHLNTFISLQENVSGYGMNGRKPTGHVTINSPGIIRVYVQGLRQLQDTSYICYAISKKEDKAIRLGSINLSNKSKQTIWKVNEKNVEQSGVNAEDIDCVAIVTEGEKVDQTDTVIVGYSRQKYLIAPLLQKRLKQEKKKTVVDNPVSETMKEEEVLKEIKLQTEAKKDSMEKAKEFKVEPVIEEKTVEIEQEEVEQEEIKLAVESEAIDKEEKEELISEQQSMEQIKKIEEQVEVVKEEKRKAEKMIEDSLKGLVKVMQKSEQDNELDTQLEDRLDKEKVEKDGAEYLKLKQQSMNQIKDIEHQLDVVKDQKRKAEKMIEDSLKGLVGIVKGNESETQKQEQQSGVSEQAIIDKKAAVEKQIEGILFNMLNISGRKEDKTEVNREQLQGSSANKIKGEPVKDAEQESEYLVQLQQKLENIKIDLNNESKVIAKNKQERIKEEIFHLEESKNDSEKEENKSREITEKDVKIQEVDEEVLEKVSQSDEATQKVESIQDIEDRENNEEPIIQQVRGENRFARIRDIFETSISINPFEDSEDIEWVRISLRELISIPNIDYEWATQPFITHAHYTHKHLILGKHKGIEQYYLGVPDRYDDSTNGVLDIDKVERFKCSRNVNPIKNEAGYWIAMI